MAAGMMGAFNAQAYLAANPDVAAAGVDPYTHWITHGQKEGRQGAFGAAAPAQPATPSAPPPPQWAPGKDASGQRDWGAYRQAAQQSTQGINAMPFMLNPQKLSAQPEPNRGLMYPGLAALMGQQGQAQPQQPGNPLLQQPGQMTPQQQQDQDFWLQQQAVGPLNGG